MTRTMLLAGLLALLFTGCGEQQAAPKQGGADTGGLPAGVLLSTAPAGARDILAIKKEAKEGDAVVFQGQVGGSKHPFVKGRAAMLVSDLAMRN